MARVADGDGKAAAEVVVPEVPVMTGTHFHALDEKGRVIIPAKLRPALTEQFWMMLDENDNVSIYNYKTGLDVLEHCERMIAEDPENEDIAYAVERITGAAELMTVENGWRVPVPEILRYYAELDKEVVTVGVLNHAVLWSRDKWEQAQTRRLQSVEVRRAQAGLLRAAASSIKKSAEVPQETPQIAEQEEVAVAAVSGTGGRIGLGALGGGGASGGRDGAGHGIAGRDERSAAPAPAGDGKRGSRVLTLSKLGR
jgi:MraZ protein